MVMDLVIIIGITAVICPIFLFIFFFTDKYPRESTKGWLRRGWQEGPSIGMGRWKK